MNDRRLFLTQLGSGLVTATAGLTSFNLPKDSEVVIAPDLKTIALTADQQFHLATMLNIALRDRNLTDGYRQSLDGIFVQLGERHHESTEWTGLLFAQRQRDLEEAARPCSRGLLPNRRNYPTQNRYGYD